MTDISHMIRQSEASTWDFCRRLHHFSYTRNLVPSPVGRRMPATRDYGTVFHAGAEVLHSNGALVDAEAARSAKLDELRNIRIEEHEGGLPELTKEGDKEWWDVDRYTKAMLEGYDKWLASGIDAGNTVLGVEEEWEMPLRDTGITMYGKIDLVYHSHNLNGMVVDDVKTTGSTMEEPHRADFQLRTYALAWWRVTGELPVRAGHRQAKRVLRGELTDYAEPKIPITEKILLAHEAQLIERAQDIMVARTRDATDPMLYPRTSRDCSWRCPFGDICIMVDDGDDYEFVIEQNFYVREEGEDG